MASHIDDTNKYAWGANVGWINFNPTDGGVTVYTDHLEGYAWGENAGWIRMGTHAAGGTHAYGNSSTSDYGVNIDGSGTLSSYAWGANVGWINFSPTNGGVTIDLISGALSGYAWGENTGWIRFSNTTLGASSYQVVAQMDDGPEDSIEDNVPNPTGGANGDGNGDGTPDRDQENVASLPNNSTGTIQPTAASPHRLPGHHGDRRGG